MAKIEEFHIISDYREEEEGIQELALSIYSDGLYQPITVKPNGETFEIIAGRRRFRAISEYLRWKTLKKNEHYIVKEGADALLAQFQENFNRKDFSPIEMAKLITAIHERKISEHGPSVKGIDSSGWSLKDTGNLIGRDSSFISRMLSIAKNAEVVKDAKTTTEALQAIDKYKTKEVREKVKEARAVKMEENAVPSELEDQLANLEISTAQDYLASQDDESFDLVLTDPPYAINYDQLISPDYADVYDDDPEVIKAMLSEVVPELYRVLRNDRYSIIWVAYEWYEWLKNVMIDSGFSVASIPVNWIKKGSTGKASNPSLMLASQVEVAVYGWKGSPELNMAGSGNSFPVEIIRGENRIHVAQKPDMLLAQLIETFSRKNESVLDVFAGSLSTLRGAYTKSRIFYGCEEDKSNAYEAINYTRDKA